MDTVFRQKARRNYKKRFGLVHKEEGKLIGIILIRLKLNQTSSASFNEGRRDLHSDCEEIGQNNGTETLKTEIIMCYPRHFRTFATKTASIFTTRTDQLIILREMLGFVLITHEPKKYTAW